MRPVGIRLALVALILLVGMGGRGVFAQQLTAPAAGTTMDGATAAEAEQFTAGAPARSLSLGQGQSGRVLCNGVLQVTLQTDPELRVLCSAPTPLPTATAAPATPTAPPLPTTTPGITVTPTPLPTQTPLPTSTAIPTAVVVPTPGAQIEGVPVCTDHDATRYHGLVQRDAAGTILCTYGHEHKDNPHVLDALFGAPVVQDIGYPWHSIGRNGNPEGHNNFDWAVVQDAPCIPASDVQYGFDTFRLEAHFSVISGDIARFHSYSLQAQGCDPLDPSYHGTIQTGGWIDYGQLHLNPPNPSDPSVELDQIVPLVNVPGQPFPDPNPVVDDSIRRLHGSGATPRYDATWYGAQGCNDQTCVYAGDRAISFQVGLRAEDWGGFDPASPEVIQFYGTDGYDGTPANHSYHEPAHVLSIYLPPWTGTNTNGYITYAGFTNRWGEMVGGCTAVGLDCIPLIINGMKPGQYQFRADTSGPGTREYDVASPVTGKSLITFPN